MLIRREDKELIHNLALLGALFGASVCVFMAVHLSRRAHADLAEQRNYQETHAALAKLSGSESGPEEAVVDLEILEQVQAHIQQAQSAETVVDEDSLWLRLPRWGFWGVCAAGGLAGAVGGYAMIWLTGWGGSVFVYALIRGLYRVIRKVAPDSAAARLSQQGPSPQTHLPAFERDRRRVFPTLVKLLFLLLLALGAMAAVVWTVTGL